MRSLPKKILLLSVPLLLSMFLFSFQKVDKDSIAWSKDRPLTWKDFKVTQPKGERFAALTAWSIYFTAASDGDSLKLEVICYFGPHDSKVKQEARKDSVLLRHEQYHFNIAEVYTRKFRKALEETAFRKKDAGDKAAKLYKQYFDQCKKEQDSYDDETAHSTKTVQQQQWEAKIDQQLTELDQYTWKEKKFFAK